jgi:hypothetical protein
MNLLAHCHLFFFSSGVIDDNKLGSLSSFLGFFIKCRRRLQAYRLVAVFRFFPSNVEDDDELRGF